MDDQEFAGEYGAVVLAEDRLIQYIGHDAVSAFSYAQIYQVEIGHGELRIRYYPFDGEGKLLYMEDRSAVLLHVKNKEQCARELRQRIKATEPDKWRGQNSFGQGFSGQRFSSICCLVCCFCFSSAF